MFVCLQIGKRVKIKNSSKEGYEIYSVKSDEGITEYNKHFFYRKQNGFPKTIFFWFSGDFI